MTPADQATTPQPSSRSCALNLSRCSLRTTSSAGPARRHNERVILCVVMASVTATSRQLMTVALPTTCNALALRTQRLNSRPCASLPRPTNRRCTFRDRPQRAFRGSHRSQGAPLHPKRRLIRSGESGNPGLIPPHPAKFRVGADSAAPGMAAGPVDALPRKGKGGFRSGNPRCFCLQPE